jgi:hypothetical protein
MPPTLLLVPSAGYGPPVFSGMTVQLRLPLVVPVVLPLAATVVAPASVTPDPPAQPAIGSEAAPASSQRSEVRRSAPARSSLSTSSARLSP